MLCNAKDALFKGKSLAPPGLMGLVANAEKSKA